MLVFFSVIRKGDLIDYKGYVEACYRIHNSGSGREDSSTEEYRFHGATAPRRMLGEANSSARGIIALDSQYTTVLQRGRRTVHVENGYYKVRPALKTSKDLGAAPEETRSKSRAGFYARTTN